MNTLGVAFDAESRSARFSQEFGFGAQNARPEFGAQKLTHYLAIREKCRFRTRFCKGKNWSNSPLFHPRKLLIVNPVSH